MKLKYLSLALLITLSSTALVVRADYEEEEYFVEDQPDVVGDIVSDTAYGAGEVAGDVARGAGNIAGNAVEGAGNIVGGLFR